METIDVTGLSDREVASLVEGHPRPTKKINIPMPGKNKTKEIIVKDTKQNQKLLEKYGEKIFTADGRINYKNMPVDDLCKKLMRRSVRSRNDLFDNLGEKFTKSLIKRVSKTSLKLKSKDTLKNNIRKFLGWKPEKNVRKSKDKKENKSEKKKSGKNKEEGPQNIE